MFTKTQSATLLGLKSLRVEVEVNGGRGVPHLIIVGLPSKAVNEAKERVTTSVQNLGIRIKSLKTIINLAPADLRKDSSHLEFAMAVGLLQLYKVIPPVTDDQLFLGELSLNGQLKPIRGALPLVLSAKAMGYKEIYLPTENLTELPAIPECQIFGVETLQSYLDHARNHDRLKPYSGPSIKSVVSSHDTGNPFSDIQGQLLAKRALIISAAGGHHLLMVGPPGTGKTALAETLPTLLPPLTETEALELRSLHSIAGLARPKPNQAPLRTVSSNIHAQTLVGGGQNLKVGEVTLAHHGILFLDELPEFRKSVIEQLRGPLENGQVLLNSRLGIQVFPARFTLLATANPCACGYLGSHQKVCHCSLHQQNLYHQRLSGPIRDRIELQVPVSDLNFREWHDTHQTLEFRFEQIAAARQQQHRRYQKVSTSLVNGHVPSSTFKELSQISRAAERLLLKAALKLRLSGRGYTKIMRVARTIADLEAATEIGEPHIAEALQFRLEEKMTSGIG